MVENIPLIYVPMWAPYEAYEPETLGVSRRFNSNNGLTLLAHGCWEEHIIIFQVKDRCKTG